MEIGGITVSEKIFDVAIIGGGGSGLRASLEISKSGLDVAVVSKVFPTSSHTVAAQGGITCAIASADPNDDWRWHMFDTVKGSDYIGDQNAIEYMCSEGPDAIFELEHMGYHFLDLKMVEYIKGRLEVNQKSLEKEVKQQGHVRLLIEPVMLFYILCIKQILKQELNF